jgi:DNA-binding MarR family transcriptional regulator
LFAKQKLSIFESNYSGQETGMSSGHRAELEAALDEQMRDSASRSVMLHQAIAARIGLNSTDLKCLDLARHEPSLTAGRLAELTGLSASAITTVLDRLERAGVVERQRDPADRRKVTIWPTGRRDREIAQIFATLARQTHAVLQDYDDGQLVLFTAFLHRLNEIVYQLTTSLYRQGEDQR